MQIQDAVQITCSIYRSLADRLLASLAQNGIARADVVSARAVVLRETTRLFGMIPTTVLDEDPAEYYRFYVAPGEEEGIMGTLIEALELHQPGHGSIHSCPVKLCAGGLELVHRGDAGSTCNHPLHEGLSHITCIVQRGQGNAIVQAALDLGFSVPHVSFGEGTGIRDKLGLLRITIPASKDIISFVVSRNEAREALDLLIDTGRLDLPGKGFIYVYDLAKGMVNTRFFRGKQRYAASMEQIIATIDEMKGTVDWRQKESSVVSARAARRYLENLVFYNISCNEGRAADLVAAAMAAGAAGATISRLRSMPIGKESKTAGVISPARESADLIVGPGQVEKISTALEAAGLFDNATAGAIEMRPVPRACTYLGPAR